MAYEDLIELLTGKALGILPERLDMQGWVEAFRTYEDAMPGERRAMEVGLATAILASSDWALIADAIHLARSHQMGTPLMHAAVVNAEFTAKQGAQAQYRDVIVTEAGRYLRDVRRTVMELHEERPQVITAAETGGDVSVVPGARFAFGTGESSQAPVRREFALAGA